jgi:hypothetical protein
MRRLMESSIFYEAYIEFFLSAQTERHSKRSGAVDDGRGPAVSIPGAKRSRASGRGSEHGVFWERRVERRRRAQLHKRD